jgi:hypothetical protein
MSFAITTLLLAVGLFAAMLGFAQLGRWAGTAWLRRHRDGLAKGVGAAEAAVFGILGLIVAFTFSGAAQRFHDRRHLITEEANAISTAYLRMDLLPDEVRADLRDLFRRYTNVRAVVYRNVRDASATKAKLEEGSRLQAEIWSKALAACSKPGTHPQAAMLLLPALNAMFDISTTRAMATVNHPPLVIFLLLAGLSLLGALLVGYSISQNSGRTFFHTVLFSLVLALAIFVILDLEYPRRGFIRLDAADQLLLDLSESMY